MKTYKVTYLNKNYDKRIVFVGGNCAWEVHQDMKNCPDVREVLSSVLQEGK